MSHIFNDFNRIINYFRNKRVAIIGSAPNVTDNDGKYIDSFDLVIRVNNYKTRGEKSGLRYDFTKNVGTRTDVHYSFYGSSIRKTKEDLINDRVRLCMCKLPDSQPIESEWHVKMRKLEGIDYKPHYRRRLGFWFCPTYVPDDKHFMEGFNLLGKHQLSTGFSCIYDLIRCEPSELYITGFDWFVSRIHNLNEPWRLKNTDDPIRHMPMLEKEKLFQFAKEKPFIKLDKYLTDLMKA